MKILVISNYYPPYYLGGYELACFDTVEFLKQKGHEVSVLTGNYQSSECENNVYRKLSYIDYDSPSYTNKYAVEEFNYCVTEDIVQLIQPDIVYVWSLRLISLSPLWAIEKTKIKKIFEIGDFWMKGFLSNSFLAKFKRVIKNILPLYKSENVSISPAICISDWMVDIMKKEYGSHTIHVVPNGTNISEQRCLYKDDSVMKYMFCGRIDYSKGLDMAIKALSYLKDNGFDDFEFHIYGDGDEVYLKKCLMMIDVLNLQDEVFYHGKQDNLKEAYIQNHVLLMPTRMKEPFGLVLIEAMNYGVVVIAPNDYGPKEIIDDCKDGVLFKQYDQTSLDEKIKRIHNNWDLIKYIRFNGFEKVEKKYDINIVKTKIEQLLIDEVKA
jgi:glycosyltransferase involved in cell wall biosynthesis